MRRSHPVVAPLEARRLLSAITFAEPGYYPAGLRTPPGHGAEHVAAGDFNGDGATDLVVAGDDISLLPVVQHYARVLLGKGDGTFAAPSPSMPVGVNASDVAVGDFNGDGRLDAVVSEDRDDSLVHVLLGNGDGTFRRAGSFHSGSHSSDLAVADFNEDGRLDVAVANAAPWTPWDSLAPAFPAGALLLGNGDGTLQRERYLFTGGRVQHFVEAGDVNGDGHVDTVFAQVVIGPGDFAAPESLVFASIANMDLPARPATEVPAAVTGLKLADLDGDGRLDVAVSAMRDFMGTNGVAATLSGVGDGRFLAPKLYPVSTAIANDVAVADFNADGRPDLAVSGEDGRWGRPMPVPAVITLENSGGGAFGNGQIFPLPEDAAYPGDLAVGRFNNDVLPDVAVALPGSNQVGVLVNTTKAIVSGPARLRTVSSVLNSAPLARFAVTGARPTADAFAVTINWGDGSRPTAGVVVANDDGSFTVLGSHSYRQARIYRVTISIRWPSAETARHVSAILRVAPRRG
jgi:hypothetical protein